MEIIGLIIISAVIVSSIEISMEDKQSLKDLFSEE